MNGHPFQLSAEHLRRSLTCLPFDGQYQSEVEGHHGLRVAEHVCRKRNLNYAWLWSRWDGAHEMELGVNDVRKLLEFYQALAGFCAARQAKYLYGKGHERARQWAERWNARLESLGSICTTRFHSSERRSRPCLGCFSLG